MFDCLTEIIGVTDTDCECLVADLDEETKEALSATTSGFYMDDIPDALNFKILKTLDSCKSFATMAIEARDQAIKDFQDATTVAISNLYKKAARNYNGSISKAAYAHTMTDDRQYQGIRLLANERTDAVMKINRIRLIGNAAGTMDLIIARTLKDQFDFEIVHTLPVTTLVNNFATVALPSGGITLPLGKDLIAYDYRVYYDRSTNPTFFPKDTPIGCMCSGGDRDLLETYLIVQGLSFLDPLANAYTTDEYSHGLLLDVEIVCKTEALLCREYLGNEDLQIASKYAVAYRANEILNEKVLGSTEINRSTMQSREHLYGKRNHFRKQYEERIIFFANRVDIENSDCFNCRPRTMWKGKVRS